MNKEPDCFAHGYCTLQSDCKKFRQCACGNTKVLPHCMYCLLPEAPTDGSANTCPECRKSLEGAPVVKV